MNRITTATLIASSLFLGLIVFSVWSKTANYTYVIAIVGAIATLYLGLIKYWVDTDTMFKSLFQTFNQRFDDMNERLNEIVANKQPSGAKTQDQVIQDYLNLCSEEFYWYKKGRIPAIVWLSWLEGIKYYLANPDIKAFFTSQVAYDKSYYGFLASIKKHL